ncbi:hypothetical protein JAAARDRAFT_180119 [Jaapia argillacea MUCL 33604]|uniref:F-box domain-containing protein n=1 Tax=Jaapia argillacea MUCL 33604 TaxID=933084 RepID=A0A067PXH2_9AGAM|nr:hypothetical protein JAAARDRAFT_180119 [Jaapia argillacea MUCL 33604]
MLSLLSAPRILEEIVLCAICLTPLTPPIELRSLLLTSRAFNACLSFRACPGLYVQIFEREFDTAALKRRFSNDLSQDHVAFELRRRFTALQCIRQCRFEDPRLTDALLTAYLMFLEDDDKNWTHLLNANLPYFAKELVRRRLRGISRQDREWPSGNGMNTFAMALLWFTTSEASIQAENAEERHEMLDLLAPFVYAAFRYPCADMPEHEFHPPEAGSAIKMGFTAHGPYPPLCPKARHILYFGQSFDLRPPHVAVYAILSYFVRREVGALQIPDLAPRTRAESPGLPSVTRADIEEFNARCRTHFVQTARAIDHSGLTKSQKHDPDWARAIGYSDPSPTVGGAILSQPRFYRLGMLTGLWRGSSIVPCGIEYKAWLDNERIPSLCRLSFRVPLYFRLQEHYCYSPSLPLLVPDSVEGFRNAWFPQGCTWVQHEDGLELFNASGSPIAYYVTPHAPSGTGPVNQSPLLDAATRGVVDIILTGQTDTTHSEAYGGFRFFGRVRPADGLIVMVREPLDPTMDWLGRSVFRGHLLSSQNMVGRWRPADTGVEAADWEVPWSVCKSMD